MSAASPEPYSERVRLAAIISDARELLVPVPVESAPADVQVRQLAARVGQLEATLAMLADSAEIIASDYPSR